METSSTVLNKRKMMKFTDLNIDCLENVFEYLEFVDLLSAASSNKRLNKAANFIFVREYCRKSIQFENIRLSADRITLSTYYFIIIRDLKTSLQLIRCFGHLFFTVQFKSDFKEEKQSEQYVINYINEYCSDNLREITIKNGLIGWELCKKPFSKVQNVNLYECTVSDKYCINKLFPKMQKISAHYHSSDGKSFFVSTNHFPNLKRFIYTNYKFGAFDNPAAMLRLNPQLEDVAIFTNQPLFDSTDFRDAMKTLQNLQKLVSYLKFLNANDIVIHLENVTSFETVINSNYDDDMIQKIPFSFGKLEILNITFANQLNAQFFSFIDQHPTVKKLTLTTPSLSVTDQLKLAKSLPSLVSISLCECKISANEAIQFMSKFQNLTDFHFWLNEADTFDDFRSRLSNEWEGKTIFGLTLVNKIVPKTKKCKLG